MISEVCYKIKEKRRILGYSIEQVVEKTKLHPMVIEDIEDNNLSNIGPAYLKGFIKIYASFLKIDLGTSLDEIEVEKPAIKAINIQYGQDNETDKVGGSFFAGLRRKAEAISPEIRKKIILVFVGLISLGFLFFAVKFAAVKISEAFKKNTKITKKLPQQTIVPPPIEEVEGVTVALTAKKRCFLRVTVDGKILFEGILNSGSVETWKGDREIELKISDGSAIQLEVNGRAIPILASIRKPIRSLKITSSGISVDK